MRPPLSGGHSPLRLTLCHLLPFTLKAPTGKASGPGDAADHACTKGKSPWQGEYSGSGSGSAFLYWLVPLLPSMLGAGGAMMGAFIFVSCCH